MAKDNDWIFLLQTVAKGQPKYFTAEAPKSKLDY